MGEIKGNNTLISKAPYQMPDYAVPSPFGAPVPKKKPEAIGGVLAQHPGEKVQTNTGKIGNLTSAEIPVRKGNRFQRGEVVAGRGNFNAEKVQVP